MPVKVLNCLLAGEPGKTSTSEMDLMEQATFLFITVFRKGSEGYVSFELTEMSCFLLPHTTGKNISFSGVFQDNFPTHLL